MLEAAIIADDFTGANATGILLKKKGLKVTTLLKPNSNIDQVNAEVISISTNSRSIDPKEAYKEFMKRLKRSLRAPHMWLKELIAR